MSAWGGSARSCSALLTRVDENDPRLVDLVVLPMKTFGGDEVRRIASAIADGRNTHLRSISASGHSVPPDALSSLGTAIAAASRRDGSSGIRSLAVGDRRMGDEGVASLCSSLKVCCGGTLQTLELGFKDLSPVGTEAIGMCFGGSRQLRHLNVSRNERIGSDGVISFCDAGKRSIHEEEAETTLAFPRLEYLDLSECNLGPEGVEALSSLFGEEQNDKVKRRSRIELMMASNPLGKESCASLSNLVRSPFDGSSHLISLSLAGCSIGDEGVEALACSSKGRGEGLCMLDLSRNGITSVGARKLSEALSVGERTNGENYFADLGELHLAGNPLGVDGVKHVCMSLQQRCDVGDNTRCGGNHTVKVLDLSETNCGSDGATCAIRCGALSSLLLFNNSLGSDGFRTITTWLRGGHPSIDTLDLGGNHAGEDAIALLLREIVAPARDEMQSALRTLVLGGNSFGNTVAAALEEVRAVKPELDVAHDRPTRGEESNSPIAGRST